ncbi:MAG: hypothetical protein ABJ327_13115 [Litoreibacter sp.]
MKVALHAHSLWSYDGKWPLGKIARVFGRLGFDAVMMSEHDTGFDPDRFPEYRAECAAASTSKCQLIPGIEYSSPDNDVHILTWGLDRFLAEHRPVMETLEGVRDAGGVAVFAHPIRREAFRLFQPEWVPLLSGIELWNRKSDGLSWGAEAAQLIAETGLAPTVGMDFHKPRHMYPLTNRFQATSGQGLEAGLVSLIGQGAQVPCAFGRPILSQAGSPQGQHHIMLERLRCQLRDLIRGKKAKGSS